MPIDAFQGPVNVFGQVPLLASVTGQVRVDNNPDWSPSLFSMGAGFADHRAPYAYVPGNSVGARGWWGIDNIAICNQVPSTASATAIAAAQVPVAGTAMTLVSSSGAGITVSTSITSASTGVLVTGLLAIDGAMGTVSLTPTQNGTGVPNLMWDPTKALARTIQLTSAGNDSSGTATVRGYDLYNFPMTETITLSNGTVATGKKAFKYVASITPGGTLSGSNLSAGQSDTIGFMLRSDLFQYLQIYWPDTTLISSNTGYTAAVTTSPATATTGDVRGTYALQTASNATRRLVMFLTLPVANVGTAVGVTGVTQI